MFGHSLKDKYFLLDNSLTNLNHGSFGAVPRPVMDNHIYLLQQQESHPDRWFRETYYKLIDSSRECISKLVHAHCDDLVLVENASSAVNSVLRSLNLKVQSSRNYRSITLLIC